MSGCQLLATCFMVRREVRLMQGTQNYEDASLMMTIKQVMFHLQLGRWMVYQLINNEGLPVHHFGRAVRVHRAELEDWIRSRKRGN